MFCVPTPFARGRQPTARKFSEFKDFYEVDWSDVIGKGGFSTVYRGTDKLTGRTVAVKKIPRQTGSKSRNGSSNKVLKQEINAAMKVKEHDNVVRLFDVFVAADVVVLCMEYMDGDVLFKHIISHGPLTEPVARIHFFKLACALNHLHKNNIVHRDLKPENIMFMYKDGTNVADNVLKITDFGLSKTLPDNTRQMATFCGTPAYLASEAWSAQYAGHTYDSKVDTWAFGVTLFVSISGYHPFDPNGTADLKVLRNNVLAMKWSFQDKGWNSISPECKDLISKLICCVENRLTADELVNHPWFDGLEDPQRHSEKRSLSEKIRALSLHSVDSKKARVQEK